MRGRSGSHGGMLFARGGAGQGIALRGRAGPGGSVEGGGVEGQRCLSQVSAYCTPAPLARCGRFGALSGGGPSDLPPAIHRHGFAVNELPKRAADCSFDGNQREVSLARLHTVHVQLTTLLPGALEPVQAGQERDRSRLSTMECGSVQVVGLAGRCDRVLHRTDRASTDLPGPLAMLIAYLSNSAATMLMLPRMATTSLMRCPSVIFCMME